VDAFSNCNKEEKTIREPFETMSDVIDAKQIAQALHLSRAGAYNLMPPVFHNAAHQWAQTGDEAGLDSLAEKPDAGQGE